MRQEWEHIDWGGNKEAELQAGCRVGTVIHRLTLCDRHKEGHGDEAKKMIQGIRDCYCECPWDPLWWCGVAAMPITPPAPAYEEFVVRENARVDLIAQGRGVH